MSFSVRHEGSPKWISGQSAADVSAGLRDGRWEPTDEVWAEGEADWVAIEDHPRFAEEAADIAPSPRKHHPDETRLDMNPLIDVSLVLLIFFILTTSYETIRKVLDLPGASSKKPGQLRKVDPNEAKKLMVMVEVRQVGGLPAIKVEGNVVGLDGLDAAIRKAVVDSKKTTLVMDADLEVDYGVVMAIMDAARGAGVTKTLTVERK
jgi:biopolymer transport protein ExbD